MSEAEIDTSNEHEILIDSRFGEVSVNLTNAIYFPQGLLGLQDDLYFALTEIPQKNLGQFKLLQCLNDHSLSFVVLPLDIENEVIQKDDLVTACKHTKINIDDLAILLIASVQRSPDAVNVTVNLRAPILIDTNDKAALQFVFSSSKYNICHQLNK